MNIMMFRFRCKELLGIVACAIFVATTAVPLAARVGAGLIVAKEPEEIVPSDTTPPVVSASDFEITVGDTVSYKKQIEVSDDVDEAPEIVIDNSQVDLETPGQYPVIYTVSDSAGNQTVAQITLTVKEKIYTFDENAEGYLSQQARKILAEIIDDDMNDMQKAYAIYRWTKRHIAYTSTSDKSDYRIGARDGFNKRGGDCFTYFSVSKVLLDEAGIENIDMVKLRTSSTQARHYWSLINVGDGWYHFDSTQYRAPKSNFFMVTDKELKAWDQKYYKNAHNYDPEGLPEMATESVQHLINYNAAKLTLPSDEPETTEERQ